MNSNDPALWHRHRVGEADKQSDSPPRQCPPSANAMTIPTFMRAWPPRPYISVGRAHQRMSVTNRNWLGNHPMPAEHRRGLNSLFTQLPVLRV